MVCVGVCVWLAYFVAIFNIFHVWVAVLHFDLTENQPVIFASKN